MPDASQSPLGSDILATIHRSGGSQAPFVMADANHLQIVLICSEPHSSSRADGDTLVYVSRA
jgi:hypothetical protein